MFGLDSCVQALLKGVPRFHNVCGQVRMQEYDGGVVMQLRVSGLPCGACQSFYRLCVEGGCGCPSLELAVLPAWQGEAAATCFLGGFSPESLIRRCVFLAMNGSCGGRVADGVFRPCRGMDMDMCDCRPSCRAPCAPLYPSLRPCALG